MNDVNVTEALLKAVLWRNSKTTKLVGAKAI